jgi:hypothetical protein
MLKYRIYFRQLRALRARIDKSNEDFRILADQEEVVIKHLPRNNDDFLFTEIIFPPQTLRTQIDEVKKSRANCEQRIAARNNAIKNIKLKESRLQQLKLSINDVKVPSLCTVPFVVTSLRARLLFFRLLLTLLKTSFELLMFRERVMSFISKSSLVTWCDCMCFVWFGSLLLLTIHACMLQYCDLSFLSDR